MMLLIYDVTFTYSIFSFLQLSGYVPPEYVKRGMYSKKYDVFSFGVLLLQIISGKKTSNLYGVDKNLTILEHVSNLQLFIMAYT